MTLRIPSTLSVLTPTSLPKLPAKLAVLATGTSMISGCNGTLAALAGATGSMVGMIGLSALAVSTTRWTHTVISPPFDRHLKNLNGLIPAEKKSWAQFKQSVRSIGSPFEPLPNLLPQTWSEATSVTPTLYPETLEVIQSLNRAFFETLQKILDQIKKVPNEPVHPLSTRFIDLIDQYVNTVRSFEQGLQSLLRRDPDKYEIMKFYWNLENLTDLTREAQRFKNNLLREPLVGVLKGPRIGDLLQDIIEEVKQVNHRVNLGLNGIIADSSPDPQPFLVIDPNVLEQVH